MWSDKYYMLLFGWKISQLRLLNKILHSKRVILYARSSYILYNICLWHPNLSDTKSHQWKIHLNNWLALNLASFFLVLFWQLQTKLSHVCLCMVVCMVCVDVFGSIISDSLIDSIGGGIRVTILNFSHLLGDYIGISQYKPYYFQDATVYDKYVLHKICWVFWKPDEMFFYFQNILCNCNHKRRCKNIVTAEGWGEKKLCGCMFEINFMPGIRGIRGMREIQLVQICPSKKLAKR